MANLARPQPATVDDVFRIDGAAGRGDVPGAVGPLCGFGRRGVSEVLCAIVPGRLGEGVGCARGVKIPVLIIPQGSQVVLGIDQRVALGNFLQGDKLLLQPHIARLGPLALEVVVPGLVGRQIEPAGHMQTDRLSGQLLDLLVKTDGIALQARDVGVRADGVDLTRRVPRRPGGQLVTLKQDSVLPAEFGKVEQDRTAHDTAADNYDLGVGVQLLSGAGGFLDNLWHGVGS